MHAALQKCRDWTFPGKARHAATMAAIESLRKDLADYHKKEMDRMTDFDDAMTDLGAKMDALSLKQQTQNDHLATLGTDFRADIAALEAAIAGNSDAKLTAAAATLRAFGGRLDQASTNAQGVQDAIDALDAAAKAAMPAPAPAPAPAQAPTPDPVPPGTTA